ncbi:unnamed protein product [Rotaria socialis]
MSKLVSDRHSRLIIYFWIIFNQSENLWQESYYFHSDQLQKQQQQARNENVDELYMLREATTSQNHVMFNNKESAIYD